MTWQIWPCHQNAKHRTRPLISQTTSILAFPLLFAEPLFPPELAGGRQQQQAYRRPSTTASPPSPHPHLSSLSHGDPNPPSPPIARFFYYPLLHTCHDESCLIEKSVIYIPTKHIIQLKKYLKMRCIDDTIHSWMRNPNLNTFLRIKVSNVWECCCTLYRM